MAICFLYLGDRVVRVQQTIDISCQNHCDCGSSYPHPQKAASNKLSSHSHHDA
jgi:hypothetical protein